MEAKKKKIISHQISFYSDETEEEIMLAATFYLKKFLPSKNRIVFNIPERVYLNLGEEKFREIFSDQIIELDNGKENFLKVNIVKSNKYISENRFETFEIKEI